MLKSLLHLGKLQMKQYLYYKSNFYLFTLNRVVEVIVYIFVWFAIYNQTGEISGFAIDEIVTYYILMVSLSPIALWGINEDMSYSIRKGNISKELLNPISYFKYYFGIELGEMGFATVISVATFIICAIFWTVKMPSSILSFLLFLVVILMNIPISYFVQMIIGTCGFYTNSIWGMEILRKSIISIFSGIIAPLTMFPIWFQNIANILPFKEFIYTPINIYLGKIGGIEVLLIILKQAIWMIILYLLAKAFFNRAVKKITINGG